MKIHILGASGSGVTTLGQYLSRQLAYPYFDNDDYFWCKTTIPFTEKRPPGERNSLLANDLNGYSDWIVGGSMVSWGDSWLSAFDLVVFLWLPPTVRLNRLREREYDRYGSIIFTDPDRKQKSETFLEWAAGYDDPAFTRRSLSVHETWLSKLACPVIEIRGDFSVEQRAQLIREKLNDLNTK